MTDIVVNRISPFQQLSQLKKGVQHEETDPTAFPALLSKAVAEVSQLQKDSDQHINKILSGEVSDVHTAMIAMQKADLSFQLMMQVRNKLVDAYHEIMRMQV